MGHHVSSAFLWHGDSKGKPEGVCLPPEPLWYSKRCRCLRVFDAERQRKDCGEGLPEWSGERNARTGFEMEVKPTSFTFCLFPPILEHEKENKVRPVRLLFSFPPSKNDCLLQTGSNCQKLFTSNPLSLKKALWLGPRSHWQQLSICNDK